MTTPEPVEFPIDPENPRSFPGAMPRDVARGFCDRLQAIAEEASLPRPGAPSDQGTGPGRSRADDNPVHSSVCRVHPAGVSRRTRIPPNLQPRTFPVRGLAVSEFRCPSYGYTSVCPLCSP